MSYTEKARLTTHFTNNSQFAKDKFNIIIENKSDKLFNHIEIVLVTYNVCTMYTKITIDTINISSKKQKLFSYDLTKDIIPMSTRGQDISKTIYGMNIFVTPDEIGKRLQIYHYDVDEHDDESESEHGYDDDMDQYDKIIIIKKNKKYTTITDENDPSQHGVRPPNLKIILKNNDINVISYDEF